MCTSIRVPPTPLSTDNRTNVISIAKDRQNCDLQQMVINQQAQLNAPPQPIIIQQAPGLQCSHIRVYAPRTFSGVSNDKGVYDPTPRDFIRNMRNYLVAEEEAAGNPLTDHNKIVLVSMLLDQSTAMWYEQIMAEYAEYRQMADRAQQQGQPVPACTGPLLDLDTFWSTFLQQFKDVNI
ncbi:unnamed protein product [Peniophora sp. CBMAI 1063]|nr:unnamed protein product [Peniophora sp. CBMAI 1063]